MIWQDIIIGAGAWLFTIALLPAITGPDKPPISTSLLTALIMTAYVICFFTLNLWLSASSGGLTAIAWWVLFIQKYRMNKTKGKELK